MKVPGKFLVLGKQEVYHELGRYEFKLVLNPGDFKNGHGSKVSFIDSDGKEIKSETSIWGRKMNCSFFIDENVADGVATINLSLSDGESSSHDTQLRCWIIKP